MRIIPWKLILLLEICDCLLFSSFTATNKTKKIKKISEGKFKENGTRKLMICQEMSRFRYFRLPVVHTCAVNVSLELLENFHFSPWKVLENSLDLRIRILHGPWLLLIVFFRLFSVWKKTWKQPIKIYLASIFSNQFISSSKSFIFGKFSCPQVFPPPSLFGARPISVSLNEYAWFPLLGQAVYAIPDLIMTELD